MEKEKLKNQINNIIYHLGRIIELINESKDEDKEGLIEASKDLLNIYLKHLIEYETNNVKED